MKIAGSAHGSQIKFKQWLALGLAVALGGLAAAMVLFVISPRSAGAAGLAGGGAAPADNCNLGVLKGAVASGGSLTFACVATTTIKVDKRLTVTHNLTLDGGGKTIISGANQFGIFVVQPGVHLTLHNLVLRDANVRNISAYGGAILNFGVLNVSSSQFISNTATGGAAVYDAPDSSATISGGAVNSNTSPMGGALLNGDYTNPTHTASLSVANTSFSFNHANFGAAIANDSGTTTVSHGNFFANVAGNGGAIYNLDHLSVSDSQFESNGALLTAPLLTGPLSQPQAANVPAGSINAGGAINATQFSSNLITNSQFDSNLSLDAGGAIIFGTLPLDSNVNTSAGGLILIGDSFDSNCTRGAGGALTSSNTASVSDSTFSQNRANIQGCLSLSQPAGSAAASPSFLLPAYLRGPGGAIFSDGPLTISNASFISNTATITSTGGGGALTNFSDGHLWVRDSAFTGNTTPNDGGALFLDDPGTAVLIHDDFTGNSATLDSGGAIANLGFLTVTQSSFTANLAGPATGPLGYGGGAIMSVPGSALNTAAPNRGGQAGPNGAGHAGPAGPQLALPNSLLVDHSTFTLNQSDYEGGAFDSADTTVVASTFQSNTSAYGGAFDVLSNKFVVSGSTFVGNAVVHTDRPASQGGAIDSNGYSVSIVNSTFYHNSAAAGAVGGAINGDSGVVTLTNVSLISNTAPANHGGALSANKNFVLLDTLIAYNLGGNCQFTMTLNLHPNLEFPGTTCGGASVQADPKALAPANNGGPTLTSALLLGSPAIDAGENATCASTDQRGAPRPFNGTCDIGAFEFGALVGRLWLPEVRK